MLLRTARPATRLTVEPLEDRLTPALTFQFDYSFDTNNFFSDPTRRAALERSAAEFGSRITTNLAAITPTGGDTWQATFYSPSDGTTLARVDNRSIPADTLLVFVGSMDTDSAEAGFGGPGGYSVAGSAGWQNVVTTRGHVGFSTWGGSVSFDKSQSWYFGADAAGLGAGQIDFDTVVEHELGHVLGFGTSPEFSLYVNNGVFTGPTATTLYGGPVALGPDLAHWAQSTMYSGEHVSMHPQLVPNARVEFSDLDYAALRDIGWDVTGVPQVDRPNFPPANPPVDAPLPAPLTTPQVIGSLPAGPASRYVAASGPDNNSVQLYAGTSAGTLNPQNQTFQPFQNFSGPVRVAFGDLNGDGTQDLIVGTGPGGGSQIRILDGRLFTDLVPSFSVFESSFTGGVFVAAGDFNNDGFDEFVVTPDEGGGPRVVVYRFSVNTAVKVNDFLGIDDPNFRGGARPAVGDINRDGFDDLVIAAGFGGGPRVSLYDGRTVIPAVPGQNRVPTKLVADFFVFEQTLRNGVYVTVGDINGDGFGDLICGAGPGGGPRVLGLSGFTIVSAGGGVAAVNAPLSNFFAGAETQRGGVRVAWKDVNQDGIGDIVTGSGEGFTGDLRVYVGTGGARFRQPPVSFNPFPAVPTANLDGIYVG